ncbi:unnamed protein product [Rotaria sp. Silwood2]|nr:unnamed protein product [Rotaria sp. Silwood2]CAF3311083.1 unnamed protein product [Rotaria sp. Silwood2]CAF4250298.1 unnamed protein product [Rotaria sp. Silwood2]CAF4430515.1 unnamed protein product [Rotaria sp. Silwood2]
MRDDQLIYLWVLVNLLVTVGAHCNCKSSTEKFSDSTAFLFLDYEVIAVALMPNSAVKTSFLSQSLAWLQAVRGSVRRSTQIMFSRVEFRPGYPEISCRNKQLSAISKLNLVIEGTPGTEFYPGFQPQANEIQFVKRRVSAAYNSELLILLDSQCIKTVVLAGLSTSSVILSTTRQLADMDFIIYIIRDAVIDSNSTVNEVLLDSVLTSQATVLSIDAAKKML